MTLTTDYFGHPERLLVTTRAWFHKRYHDGLALTAGGSNSGQSSPYDFYLLQRLSSLQKRLVPLLVIILVLMAIAAGWDIGEPIPTGGLLVVVSFTLLFVGIVSTGFFPNTPKPTQMWQVGFVIYALLQGAGWALLAEQVAARLFFSPALSAQMTAAALALLAIATALPLRAAVHGLIWPGFGLQVIGTFSSADAGVNASALGGLMMTAFILFITDRLTVMMNARHSDRIEKDALIHALEEAKLHSDEARKRAEDLNLTKSRFLATVSHELRTPLNAILGFSEVMKDEMLGQHQVPTYRDYANDIHRSGQLLLSIIDEVLDLSKIEAGRYDLHESLIDLEATVTDCAHLLQMRAHQRDLSILLQISLSLPPIYADERAVRQIMLNLLSNAIKFTPSGGDILVQVGQTEAGGHYVSVSDTGHGIPANEIPLILESFGRGSLAIKAAEQGSGLGLPIVRGLIDLHQGEFAIESREGEGTRVIVTFPPERAGKRHDMPHPPVITRIPAEAA
jgi:two-component system cell cycle sensor histidine kinase PleC